MSEASMEHLNSNAGSFYTIDDSDFEGPNKTRQTQSIQNPLLMIEQSRIAFKRSVAKAHTEFQASGKIFEDQQFPAINANLFQNPLDLKAVIEEVKHVSWVRPHQIHKSPIFYDVKSTCSLPGLTSGLLTN